MNVCLPLVALVVLAFCVARLVIVVVATRIGDDVAIVSSNIVTEDSVENIRQTADALSELMPPDADVTIAITEVFGENG